MEIREIAIENLIINDKIFVHKEKKHLNTALKKSIAYFGCILEPLLVHNEPDKAGKYVVDDGRRRLEAVKELNAKKSFTNKIEVLPCIVKDDYAAYTAKEKAKAENDRSDDEEESKIGVKAKYAAFTANLSVGKLDKDVVAIEIAAMHEKGLGYGAIAQRLGCSKSYVAKLVKMAESNSSKTDESNKTNISEVKRFKNFLGKIQGTVNNREDVINAISTLSKYLDGILDVKEV